MFLTSDVHHDFLNINSSYFYLHAADLYADPQLIKISFYMEFLELQVLRIDYAHPELAKSILCMGNCIKYVFECLNNVD